MVGPDTRGVVSASTLVVSARTCRSGDTRIGCQAPTAVASCQPTQNVIASACMRIPDSLDRAALVRSHNDGLAFDSNVAYLDTSAPCRQTVAYGVAVNRLGVVAVLFDCDASFNGSFVVGTRVSFFLPKARNESTILFLGTYELQRYPPSVQAYSQGFFSGERAGIVADDSNPAAPPAFLVTFSKVGSVGPASSQALVQGTRGTGPQIVDAQLRSIMVMARIAATN